MKVMMNQCEGWDGKRKDGSDVKLVTEVKFYIERRNYTEIPICQKKINNRETQWYEQRERELISSKGVYQTDRHF